MAIEEWKKLKEELVEVGYRKIIKKHFELPDGSTKIMEIILAKDSADVVALTPDNKVILARQFRAGPEQVLDELPAGEIEDGETPLEAVKKELLEETGYTGDFEYVGSCIDDAYSVITRHTFIAKNCKKVQEVGDGEFTEVILKSVEEFKRQIHEGKLSGMRQAYMGLEFLNLL